MIIEQIRQVVERAVEPYSARAFVIALVCVAAATILRVAIGLFGPDILAYASYFPAVMVAALVAGVPAAVLVTILSIVMVLLFFAPAERDWAMDAVNALFFAISGGLIILIAEAYRRLLETYRAQERERSLMLRELDHRGKNTFAVVEAIVTQTLHDDKARAEIITGRIRAVSSTNDIISQAADLQPDLRTLIQAKFAPFGDYRASLTGDNVRLDADAARNLSLVFHELVTNAIKHGALSQPAGRIEIAWERAGQDLTIRWTERGGPQTSAPDQRGFGTRLVSGCVRNLGGRVEAEFPPEGLICTITIPHGKALA